MNGLRRQKLGGGSNQTLYGGRKSERVLDLFLMQALCSSDPWFRVVEETCWFDVYKVFVDFVENPQADLSSSMFQTCPFQIFEHRYYAAW